MASEKSIDLNFNFDTEVPGPGDPNQYRNLAPGASISAAERLRNALRAERFEVYEETFAAISDLIGTLNFNPFTLAEADKDIGNMITDILRRIDTANERISTGGFPIRELYGRSVFRSYANQTPDSVAIIAHNASLSIHSGL